MSSSTSSRTPIPCRPRSSGACAANPGRTDERDWTAFRIRPGALFLVGDPKQAIYRFRGADVARLCPGARRLPRAGSRQRPVDLHQFSLLRPDPDLRQRALRGRAVGRWPAGLHRPRPVPSRSRTRACASRPSTSPWPTRTARPSAEQQRDGEAEAVADMCARLIGSEPILDRETGERRVLPARRHRLAGADRQRSVALRGGAGAARHSGRDPGRQRPVPPPGDSGPDRAHARPRRPARHAGARRAAARPAGRPDRGGTARHRLGAAAFGGCARRLCHASTSASIPAAIAHPLCPRHHREAASAASAGQHAQRRTTCCRRRST